ncbi:MAG: HD domain-containing protein [Bacteroidota bacterium]
MDFGKASEYVTHRLQTELSPDLFYHSPGHTFDVVTATRRLCEAEQVDAHSALLIETAALYHDTGMIFQYRDHEGKSIGLARETLPGFGYSQAEIDLISNLIYATGMPQRPAHLHEQILCDADLDYLGRNDYLIRSYCLRLELQLIGLNNATLKEWISFQVDFLSGHTYFTGSAKSLRNDYKRRNLEELRNLLT